MDATEILTAVLVAVTSYYAWQNRQMVREMAATREITVLPKLAIDWTMTSSTIALPTVRNVGPGPALSVDITLHYVPLAGKEDKLKTRRWTANLMMPGESKQFLPLESDFSGSMGTEELAATYESVRLSGQYLDVLGKHHSAEDALENIAEWQRVSGEAIARWQDPDTVKRQAKELAEHFEAKFKPTLETLAQEISALQQSARDR